MRVVSVATFAAASSRAVRAPEKAGASPSDCAMRPASVIDLPSATRSRGVARPIDMRLAIRATSCTPSHEARSSSRMRSSATSVAIASWRARIAARSPSGAQVHSRRRRRPIGVRARCKTLRSVPSVPPERRVRSTSKLRSVVPSSTTCAARPARRGGRRCASGRTDFPPLAAGSVPRPRCVSIRWRSRAPAAVAEGASSLRSKLSSVRTPKCSLRSATASAGRNIQPGTSSAGQPRARAARAAGRSVSSWSPSGRRSSLGPIRASTSSRSAASHSSTVNSPVESSTAATAARASVPAPVMNAAAMRFARESSRSVSSTNVPGERTRVTPRSTTPLASAGSCSCSHTAMR